MHAFEFKLLEIQQPKEPNNRCMNLLQLARQLSRGDEVLTTSKFGLVSKVQTVYCTFARIVTAVIVLAFGVLSLPTTFTIGPIEIKH